jgi:hypothetical protein
MSQSRQVRFGSLLVLSMGLIGLTLPETASASQPFHCDGTMEVYNCDTIPQIFINYCSTCQLGVGCALDVGTGISLAWCDHEI